MKYDIFISYKRRGTSSATAAYLYELLLKKGYNVFFDRKELRSGMFDEQLLTHISNAKDVIILLEETSLAACFDKQVPDYYKSDWFCKEVMHALSIPGKNVIPILLEGYKMPAIESLPPEMKDLPRCQALSLEISDVEEFYQKYFVDMEYLKSMPTNMSRIRQSRTSKASISNLLFVYDGFCYDINEYGEYIATIDENNDENHPYKHGVEFAGEHKILCTNNDTCEHVLVNTEVAPYHQRYICIEWEKHQMLWELKESDIQKEEDADTLYFWGKGLFDGTRTHEPCLEMSLLCFDKALGMHHKETEEFIKNCWMALCDRKVLWVKRKQWIERAARLGVVAAMRYLGKAYNNDRNYELCCKWYKEAIKNGDVPSMLEVAKLFSDTYISWPFTLEEITNGLAQNLVELLLKIEELANGEELLDLGDLVHSIESYEWVKEKPKHSGIKILELSASKGCSDAHFRIGMIQEDQNDYEGAIKEYVKAKKSNNPIRALNDIARCQYWSKKYSEAKQTCELILRETEKSDDTGFRIAAYLRLADIAKRGLLDGVNVKEAVSLYEKIVDEDSDNLDAIANLALLYELHPELDTQKSRRHYENLIRLRPAKRLSDVFFHLGTFERLEVWLSLAHAFANGICCDKDNRIALGYYFWCTSYYDFSHHEAYANMAKNDLKIIMEEVDTENRDIQYYIAYIDYELYSDAQKIMELVEKGICDWNYEQLAAIIYEEEFGAKKLEKRKAYYLTGDNNLYKSIQDPSLLWEFIKPYGRDIVMNETQNI